jgi:hypothetical protein
MTLLRVSFILLLVSYCYITYGSYKLDQREQE